MSRLSSRLCTHAACGIDCDASAMTAAEFRELIAGSNDEALLGPCLHDDRVPYVFDPKPVAWIDFRSEVSQSLAIDIADIVIVGSGRLGVSLKPGNNLRAFSERSDIDVVIVNAALFDQLWYDLLSAAYPRGSSAARLSGWLRARQAELYTGWLSPLAVRIDPSIHGQRAKPLLEFNVRWFNTFKSASKHPPRRHQDVKARLYRTWRHADLYHLHSITELRRTLHS